jgi:hypothetical protein
LESIVITWRELLIVVVLILGVYAAEVLLLTRSGKGFGRRGGNAARDRELQALETEVSGLYLRVDRLQDEVERLKGDRMKGETGEIGDGDAAERPYSEAVKMAGDGADVDQLAANCGISRGEAELIIAVNRLSQQKKTPS